MALQPQPRFTQTLTNTQLAEGKALHLETRFVPILDLTMKIEWFKNGAPISTSTRIRELLDTALGYSSLDIFFVFAEDSGTYICKATNGAGFTVTSCTVTIT